MSADIQWNPREQAIFDRKCVFWNEFLSILKPFEYEKEKLHKLVLQECIYTMDDAYNSVAEMLENLLQDVNTKKEPVKYKLIETIVQSVKTLAEMNKMDAMVHLIESSADPFKEGLK